SFDTDLAQTVDGQLMRHPAMPPALMRALIATLLCSLLCIAFAVPSLFLCGPVPGRLPFGQAVIERFFPFCRYTARSTSPAVAAGVGGLLSTAEVEAGGDAARAALATAVQQTATAFGVAGAEEQRSFAAAQTAAANSIAQLQATARNSNGATQTAIAA